jgi:hypothetical protein
LKWRRFGPSFRTIGEGNGVAESIGSKDSFSEQSTMDEKERMGGTVTVIQRKRAEQDANG